MCNVKLCNLLYFCSDMLYKCIIYRLLLRTGLSFTWKRSLEC